MKQKLRLALLLVSAAVFLFSGWKLSELLLTYRDGSQVYEELSQYVSFETAPPPTAAPSVPGETVPRQPKPDVSRWPQVDFEALAQVNPDVVGWIYIPDTNINYPIVQGQDNDHYLTHMFDGKRNRAGAIFMDYRCDPYFYDRHTIIYGHHLKNKTMFSRLMRYKKQAFYDEHTQILLVTPTAYYSLRVFSGYVANNRSSAWDLDLEDEEFGAWVEELRSKSCFRTDYAPGPEDDIITLSTCTYEFNDAKFLIHAYVEEVIEKEALS